MIIDGVFSGGGVKGFAMVGAVQVLEEKGFTFQRIAGSSAGSIVAAFIMAGYSGKEIEHILEDLDIGDFLDKRPFLPFPFAKWLMMYWKLGLYKGDALEKWIHEKLRARGVVTFKDIPDHSLRVIASDITNGKLVVLPDDLVQYQINPKNFPVAKAVRMSCGIPYFFEPVRLKGKRGENIFIDGGILSNFPMWLFDSPEGKKVRPVIGLKLTGEDYAEPQRIRNAVEMFTALFRTMKDAHDSRYISKRHVKNIVFLPVKGVSATDFLVNDEKREELLQIGRLHTMEFLKKWGY
ncbi:patatin-like phospholipase family protein [Bacillus massiliglaciei]|uniref:patatin-like phospholipase family protein n=1 Tax=Bacillus massiliglaciei TaxID=1816693 RepID=UPI000A59C8CB|nr:patatin-like phospholipase family protein [Bacillus massiliglaciei]